MGYLVIKKLTRNELRKKRAKRIRKKVKGDNLKPRLSVYKSHKYLYAQIINDSTCQTLVSLSTLCHPLRDELKNKKNIEAAKRLGYLLAKKAKEIGIEKVVFDRSGYPYHGRIKTLADATREGGIIL